MLTSLLACVSLKLWATWWFSSTALEGKGGERRERRRERRREKRRERRRGGSGWEKGEGKGRRRGKERVKRAGKVLS